MAVRLSLLLLAAGGCASSYLAAADREGNAIRDEKAALVENFRREGLADPRGEVPPRKAEPPPVEVPPLMTLPDAVRIGTLYSREYQTQRESFFLAALNLGLVRRDFSEFVFSGSLSFTGTKARHAEFSDVSALALSGTRVLPWGGSVTISAEGDFRHDAVGEGRDQVSTTAGTVSILQPLLKGAGHDIAFETLTQAERDVLYAAREFELFRQNFAIEITRGYYSLVTQKRSIGNFKRNLELQDFLVRQAEALYRLGRGAQIDVFRARASLLGAQTGLIDAQQAYRLALDRFKLLLGVPVETELDVAEEIPELAELELDLRSAVNAALQNRLDLQTSRERVEDAGRSVKVARNALLPDLSLTASYSIGSDDGNSFGDLAFHDDIGTLGLNLELPLDKKAERNAYRASLLTLEQTSRSLRLAEDSVILEVRDSLRSLKLQREQIRIEEQNIEVLRKSLRKAELDNRSGAASNRDVVEALNRLTEALNSLNERVVAYELERLTLLRRVGVLFIDQQGGIVT